MKMVYRSCVPRFTGADPEISTRGGVNRGAEGAEAERRRRENRGTEGAEVERRRRENRGAEGTEGGGVWDTGTG